MRPFRPRLPLLLCVLVPVSVSAQFSTSTKPATPASTEAVSDPGAVALTQRAVAALTGGALPKDGTLIGTARRVAGSDEESGSATLKVLATGESRMDFVFPSGQRNEVRSYSGKGPVGRWSGPDGIPHSLVQHNLIVDGMWFLPAIMLGRLGSAPGAVLTLVGMETKDGRTVQHVTASKVPPSGFPTQATKLLQHLSEVDIYLDSSTNLPVAIAFNSHPDNDASQDVPVEIRYSDYRSVSGAQVAFHVEEFFNRSLTLDLKIDSVSTNMGLAVSSFDMQ